MAPTRTGHDFGAISNIFNQEDRNKMAHTFASFVRSKQPDGGPFYPGSLPEVANSTYQMVYTLVGGDVNDVAWVAGCDTTPTATTCIDSDGSGVVLNLKPTVTLQNLPKEVKVKATMRVSVKYGNSTYTFDLKDYTFTKRWVGAYLKVEKYVDNHVLTWHGADRTRTLPASSQTFDGNYTSTVHIVVTNPSQSPMYNVTIRDALPPELGVVTGSISDNGTYDPANHVVTWNYSNFTALRQINPGQSVTVSFQVYVRQKPGFCADPSLVGPHYVVPALYGNAGIGANCQRPYDDPYKVTNGLQQNDVTASGFLQQGAQGPQLVFDYTPVADESDIWAVRPIFDITKTLKSAPSITQGASALFEIAVTHKDRTVEPAYKALKDKYPWEFGNDTKGTGHRSPTYQLRTNTYARDLKVTDAFEVGLDFTDASNFAGAGLISGGQAGSYNPVVGKRFEWAPMSIQAGSTVTAQIFLTGNLLTPEGKVWDNCAFLGAPQLNQPAEEEVPGTAYSAPPRVPGQKVWMKNQLTSASQVTGTDGTFTTNPALTDAEVQGRIHSCAGVAVVPPPPSSPYLSLTSHGEYNGGQNGPDPFADPTGIPGSVTTINKTNPGGTPTEAIPVNSTFWYKGTIFNTGQAQATNVTYTATLTGPTYVNFVNSTNTRIYVLDNTNTVVAVVTPTSVSPTSVTFSNFNIPAGGLARVVIEAKGVAAGQQEFLRQEVTYSNNTSQPLPLVTEETTSITP